MDRLFVLLVTDLHVRAVQSQGLDAGSSTSHRGRRFAKGLR